MDNEITKLDKKFITEHYRKMKLLYFTRKVDIK